MEPSGYLPILIQALVAGGFVALILIVVPLLGPRRRGLKKDENFECGIESQGNARIPVSIKYFMTAILFVLFDVEVIFFYPYAVNFQHFKDSGMGTQGFLAVLMFVAIFLVGFYYVLKKGAFEWDK
ncbi:MAG: NADH-quinone oxidoreductase subunit A [Saprospiraceae bacterium]|nr:NADH-quinone oxidoreductase subunit A [Saprospiraceae bacterium]